MSIMYMEEYLNAFEIYYELKNDYEEKKQKLIKKIKSSNLTDIEKNERIRNLQMQCIKCKQDGGTIFTTKNNELMAFCNNHAKPCDLDIRLYKGVTIYLPIWLNNIQKEIESIKFQIMKDKYDLLFNIIDEDTALINFEQRIELFNHNSDLYNKYLIIYLDLIYNQKNKNEITKNNEILYVLINNLKTLVNEYIQTYQPVNLEKRMSLIDEIINLYKTEIIPKIKDNRELKYKINTVATIDERNLYYRLIQKSYDLEDLNIYYENEYPKIISFNV